MSQAQKEANIHDLVENLIGLGESKEEMNFWQDMYEKMDKDHKEQLLMNLLKELEDLEKVSSKP